jgi:uncharacterized protein (DUF305 family)
MSALTPNPETPADNHSRVRASAIRPSPSVNWRAAAVLGLISSTFSTVVSTLLAGRIGRDVLVDWMVVATIPGRDVMINAHPPWWAVCVGILFHQWADFTWELTFFGLLGRWTAGLRPGQILVVALPWAVMTSALEWLLFVPVFPFRQPLFPLEQVYWLGLAVHVISASMYPLFPYIRNRIGGKHSSSDRRFALAWGAAAAVGTSALLLLAAAGALDHELPWMGNDPAYDQTFMRRMAAHHAQGIDIATLGMEKARDPHLRALAKLMVASQTGENRIFAQWWRSWFHGPLPAASPAECAAMLGMLSPPQMAALRRVEGPGFDRMFVQLMSLHHYGAVVMANEAMDRARDVRLKLMADAIRHEQAGEIALMHGARPNFASVAVAMSPLSVSREVLGADALIPDLPNL